MLENVANIHLSSFQEYAFHSHTSSIDYVYWKNFGCTEKGKRQIPYFSVNKYKVPFTLYNIILMCFWCRSADAKPAFQLKRWNRIARYCAQDTFLDSWIAHWQNQNNGMLNGKKWLLLTIDMCSPNNNLCFCWQVIDRN